MPRILFRKEVKNWTIVRTTFKPVLFKFGDVYEFQISFSTFRFKYFGEIVPKPCFVSTRRRLRRSNRTG